MTKLTVIEQWWQQKEREARNGHVCPDCGGDAEWLEGTPYEPGGLFCEDCNPQYGGLFSDDNDYDNWKDNGHGQG